jgi:hypothetical protein
MNALRLNINCLCASLIAATLCACGNGPMDEVTKSTTETTSDNFQAANFVAQNDLRVEPVGGEELLIPAGTGVAVIETKVDPNRGTLVRLGIDAEEGSLPSDIWVPLDRALLANLVREIEEEEELEEEEKDGLVAKVRRATGRGMTYCYRYVKRHLMATGQVKNYLPGSSAYMAAKILPQYGFRNTGHSPSSAREGEVCVYSGGPRGHGHIEVKRNGKWWFGYGFNASPMKNRKFIACFAK